MLDRFDSIQKINGIFIVLAALTLLGSMAMGSAKISLSIAAGSVTGFANFWLLKQLIDGVIDKTEHGKKIVPKWIFVKLLLKVITLTLTVGIVLLLPVDGVAYLIGISTLVAAVIIGGLL